MAGLLSLKARFGAAGASLNRSLVNQSDDTERYQKSNDVTSKRCTFQVKLKSISNLIHPQVVKISQSKLSQFSHPKNLFNATKSLIASAA